jgi:nicotinate-nucleotide pyrophosphorylase (carboxylating)
MNLQEMIIAAIREDIPNGDITTDNLALTPRFGQAKLIAKEDLVLSGTAPFEQTMLVLEPSCKLHWYFREGDLALSKQTVCDITGDLIQILKAERVALNFLGHLSGIATYTRCFVKEVENTKVKILDTRKTLPIYRDLEKRAVLHGGGMNHRLNLSQAILIKDNHIRVAGSIAKAVSRIRSHCSDMIELEVSSLAEVKEAVDMKVDRLLLDNMDNAMIAKAMDIIPENMLVEASGNMTVDRVRAVANLGVDYISVGALTHSAPQADFSLLFEWQTSNTSASDVTGI